MTDQRGYNQPTGREKFNRLAGLSAYAGSALLTAFLIWSAFDVGIDGIKQNLETLGIGAGIAVVMFAIGFTTGRPQKK